MPAQHTEPLVQAGRWGNLPALHCRGDLPEQPWVSHGSAPHGHAVAPRGRQQRQRAFRVRHVAVGQHRDIHSRLDLRDLLRVNAGIVHLGTGASVHRQQRGARVRAAPGHF